MFWPSALNRHTVKDWKSVSYLLICYHWYCRCAEGAVLQTVLASVPPPQVNSLTPVRLE